MVDDARTGLYGALEIAGAQNPDDWLEADRIWIRFSVEAASESDARTAADTVLAQETVKALGGGGWTGVSVIGPQR